MDRHLILLTVMVMMSVFAVPREGFADAETIDFAALMQNQAGCFDCYVVHKEDDDYTREGGLGIVDSQEMGLLSLILANPDAPHHDEIHAAFTANRTLVQEAMCPACDWSAAPEGSAGSPAGGYPWYGPQLYSGADAVMAAYVTMGEWDTYVEWMEAFAMVPFPLEEVVVPSSQEGYVLRQDLSMCADVDGDGVSNCLEYWAASPYSYAGAIDPEVTDAASAWNVWACSGDPANNLKFAYYPSTQRVYVIPPAKLTWAEALDFTATYPGRTPIQATMCTIRNFQEETFLDVLMGALPDDKIWIGCTDGGRDIGHAAPNPQDWYWLSDPSQSQMTWTSWDFGYPNGVDGAKDCAIMKASLDGGFSGGTPARWYDVSEFTGSPPVPATYFAILELPDLYPDDDANGAPDAFEDRDGDLLPDGFEGPCPYAGALTAQGAEFHDAVMAAESVVPDLKDALVALGVTAWSGWDIEGIEDYPPDAPGDGLPDYAQMTLVEYVACSETIEAGPSVFAAMTINKGLFESDVAALSATYPELAVLDAYKDLFAGLIGSSPEMKATINAIILEMTGGGSGLPSLNQYVIFGSPQKSLPWFAGYGNFDGDGLTNAEEWAAVVAAGKGLDEFLIAATDPDNFWHGNPEIPVTGPVGAGLLVGSMLLTAARALRRKQ